MFGGFIYVSIAENRRHQKNHANDSTDCNITNRKIASRWSLQNPIRCNRHGYKSPNIHVKMAITMIIPIMIPDIFSFVTRIAFAS
jgi:hypothetical protein